MTEHGLQKREGNFPTEQALEQINSLVSKLKDSKALPAWVQNESQLLMCVLAGREAGMGPMESLNSFYLVNGKFTVYGPATISQLRRHGYRLKWGKCDTKEANVTITAPNGDSHDDKFTIEEANLAGLVQRNEVWKKYPAKMLRWKVIGQAVRFFCPEVLNGAYVREEMDGEAAPETVGDAEFSEQDRKDFIQAEAEVALDEAGAK